MLGGKAFRVCDAYEMAENKFRIGMKIINVIFNTNMIQLSVKNVNRKDAQKSCTKISQNNELKYAVLTTVELWCMVGTWKTR